MSTATIALAYCIDNIKVAEEIEHQLQRTNYRFEHFYCKKSNPDAPLGERLRNQSNPILMVVTDNFLKSAQCMSKGLQLLQSRNEHILPIVADGRTKNEETGEVESVTTNFERVSDIIQYINYWQDQYLDLRRQKRQLQGLDEEKFNEHLRVMREISSEAGEFLRILRNMDYISFDRFKANSFEAFFDFMNDTAGWEEYKSTVHYEPPAQPSPELNEAEDPQSAATKEEEGVDPSEIPGIDLLEGKENIARIITQHSSELHDKEEEATSEPEDAAEEQPSEQENMETSETAPAPSPQTPASETQEQEKEEEEPPEVEKEASEKERVPVYYPKDEDEEDENEEDEEALSAQEAQMAQETLERAMQYADEGQIDASMAVLREGIQQFLENIDLRYNYALLLAQEQNDYPQARQQLRQILDRQPNHPNANFLMGELAELEENYREARHYYERAAHSEPEQADIYYRLGIVLSNHFQGEEEHAAKCFKRALKINDDHIDAHYQYAMLMSDALNRPKKAVKYFKKTLKLKPDHPFAHYDLALLYYRLGEREDAREAYQNAIRINPELQTAENDAAFGYREPAGSRPEAGRVKQPAAPVSTESSNGYEEREENFTDEENVELSAIEALKENITRLEELLHSRTTAPTRLRQDDGKGKIVLITGATSGIGRATAKEFAEHGYRLILTGRREERLRRLQNIFSELYNTEVKILPFDLRDPEAIQNAFEQLSYEWRQIDVLVNNAGKAKGYDPIFRGKLEHWNEMIDTNLKGLLFMTRAVAPYMVKRQSGHIINVASTAGKEVYPNGNVYCATKSAVEALTKAMRVDLHKYNIRVSQVAPGHVEQTEFALVRFDGDEERSQIYEDFTPLNSRDVAETIYFIASRPEHVNIQDILMMGTQQASSTMINRTGRAHFDMIREQMAKMRKEIDGVG